MIIGAADILDRVRQGKTDHDDALRLQRLLAKPVQYEVMEACLTLLAHSGEARRWIAPDIRCQIAAQLTADTNQGAAQVALTALEE